MALDESARTEVSKLQGKAAPFEAALRKIRLGINAIYMANDEPIPYADLDSDAPTIGASAVTARKSYGRREFFEKPLATVVAQILGDFEALDEHELYDKMIEGGYDFGEPNVDRAKSNLKISLGKNIKFDKTPRGHYVISTNPRKAKATPAATSTENALPTPSPAPSTIPDPPKAEETVP